MSGSIGTSCGPYREPAPVPPQPKPYREPPWKRLAFVAFLLMGPLVAIGFIAECALHLGPPVVGVGMAFLVAQVVTPLSVFDSDAKRRTMRAKLAASFWALPWLTHWLARWTWCRLCQLTSWIATGDKEDS